MKIKGLLASLAALFTSSMALSEGVGLGFDVKYGQRYSRNYKTEKVNGKDKEVLNQGNSSVYTFGVNYQIMDLPLAVGLDTSIVSHYNGLEENVNSNFGLEIAPKLKTWLPESVHGLSYLRPYAEVGGVAYGFRKHETKTVKEEFSVPGFVAGTGFDVSLNDMVAVNFGYTYLYQKISIKEVVTDGKKTPEADLKKANDAAKAYAHSHQFGFGLNVSI